LSQKQFREAGIALVVKAFKLLNLRISRYQTSRRRLFRIMDTFEVDLVLDVGANSGQFAQALLRDGFSGRIVSFEPGGTAYNALEKRAQGIPNWFPYQRVALGAKSGMGSLNIAGNEGQSSSFLEMLQTHLDSAPSSAYISREEVEIVTLDEIFDSVRVGHDSVMLKLDVQGFENEVLEGARLCLKLISVVKLECSLVSLYDGDRTFEHYFDFFNNQGFELWDIEAGHEDKYSGRLLQFDATFCRRVDPGLLARSHRRFPSLAEVRRGGRRNGRQ